MAKAKTRDVTKPRESVVKWLLESDPAIRWQVMRDLTHEPEKLIAAERAKIATEGLGKRILRLQAPKGNWGGVVDRKTWMTTIYTLTLLRDFGLDPKSEAARKMIGRVLDKITWYQLDGRPFLEGETEPCLNGRILGIGAYFGHPNDKLLKLLLSEQLEDGGWNCEAPQSKRSSFHSTICVLEGLLDYQNAKGASTALTKARKRAQEYLLERAMMRSLSTGEVIDKKWTRFSFPPTWHYDVLRGVDYLRSAGIKPDERIKEAIELVAGRQHQNGRWPAGIPHPDRIPFEIEVPRGTASRWNTLRALRVLKWYSAGG